MERGNDGLPSIRSKFKYLVCQQWRDGEGAESGLHERIWNFAI